MSTITLFANASSRDKPYVVQFTLKDVFLSVMCDCRAGMFGQLCKHKLTLVNNDPAMLYNKNAQQLNDLKQVNEWVKSTELPQVIQEIKTIEKNIKDIQKLLKSMKAKAARLMKESKIL